MRNALCLMVFVMFVLCFWFEEHLEISMVWRRGSHPTSFQYSLKHRQARAARRIVKRMSFGEPIHLIAIFRGPSHRFTAETTGLYMHFAALQNVELLLHIFLK